MIKLRYTIFMAIVAGLLMASCSQESTPVTTQTDQEDKIEGILTDGLWVTNNDAMPTQSMKDAYNKITIEVDKDYNFTWTWDQKNGQVYEMTGFAYEEKSSYEHDNGSGIWKINFTVTHINGQALPGGFYGIYAFENENSMLLNVEPDVSNWGKHPTAEEGIGSGEKGNESVYRMIKQ